jgi:excisionase family DNA binding protein
VDGLGVAEGARGRWLTLGEAAQRLGVDVTTLRGWADKGKVRVFRTPGGHRRFDPADLESLLKTSLSPRRAAGTTFSSSAASAREWLASHPWYARIPEGSLVSVRALCGDLMRILAAFTDGEPARPPHLAEGRRVGAALGGEVAGWGLSPAQSTEVFLHFKMHVTEMLSAPAQRGEDQIRSLRDADVFLGEVLQAMMEAYEAAKA